MYAYQDDPNRLLLQLLDTVGYQPSTADGPFDTLPQPHVVYETEVNGIHFTVSCAYPIPTSGICLSPREQEIARHIIKGLPNKSIAIALNISPWTVGTYIKRIFAKLNVNTRAEMVAKILRENLLESAAETDHR